MSASPSSFPPSFSSFPELDPGPSNRTHLPGSHKSVGRQHRDRHNDFNRKDKFGKRAHKEKDKTPLTAKRDKHLVLPEHWKHEEPWSADKLLDDERLKAKEDRLRVEQETLERDGWVPRPLFYSDRKGDSLNVTYGSLQRSDVPKYRPVGHGKHILGLDKAWNVYRRPGQGIEITLCGQHKVLRGGVAEGWVAGWEKGRWDVEVERTRSALETAVESDRTRNSTII